MAKPGQRLDITVSAIGKAKSLRGGTLVLAPLYGADGQIRRITRPVPTSVTVAVNNVAATGWSLNAGGIIEFQTAPDMGAVITAGFRFDVPVRFATDRLDFARATFGAGDMPTIALVEIREAT